MNPSQAWNHDFNLFFGIFTCQCEIESFLYFEIKKKQKKQGNKSVSKRWEGGGGGATHLKWHISLYKTKTIKKQKTKQK